MNDQERQVISDIFRRLEQVAHQQRDPETERFIAEKVRQQPYAPYAMAQAIYVQEQALANLNAEVEQLRAQVDELHRSHQGGGLLSGIFGGGARPPEPRHPAAGSPWGRPGPQPMPGGYPGQQSGPMPGQAFGRPSPWGGMQGRGGGGFLQNAMATAAGVAGGMMIANALSNAFGGNEAAGAASGAGAAETAGLENQAGEGGVTDPLHQEAAADEADLGDDFGAGDGGDWI